MNKGGFLLASRLLDMASETYGNHGCNDMDKDMFNGISDEDKLELEKDINRRNSSDPDEYCEFDRIPDWWWMAYFADVLAEQK